MKTLSTILLLLLFAGLAAAQVQEGKEVSNWEQVMAQTITVDGRQGYVEVSLAPRTIKRNEETVKVWLRFVVPGGSAFVKPGTDFGEFRFRTVFTCQDVGHATARTGLAYDRAGHYLFGEDYEETAGELPETVSQVLFAYFCERGPTTNEPPRLKRRFIAREKSDGSATGN